MTDGMHDILIIGGGAAGLTAAIAARAEDPEARVAILERNPRLARKLAATGNGRCNLSHRDCGAALYHCDDRNFIRRALECFDEVATEVFFAELGITLREDEQGRRYPHSEQAETVVAGLINRAREAGIEMVAEATAIAAERISETVAGGGSGKSAGGGLSSSAGSQMVGGGFRVDTAEGRSLRCRRLVLAGGGAAGLPQAIGFPVYAIAAGFGHRINKLQPVLTQLLAVDPAIQQLRGVRCKAQLSLFVDGSLKAMEYGELQLTDRGLSGIAIFDLSRSIKPGAKQIEIVIDLYPEWSETALTEWIYEQRAASPERSWESLLEGMVHKKLAAWLACRYPLREPADLSRLLKGWRVSVSGCAGLDRAQVTRGGVSCREVDPVSLESRLAAGLYLVGEMLDVDGPSGGRNLQWAWASGYLAGKAAGRREE